MLERRAARRTSVTIKTETKHAYKMRTRRSLVDFEIDKRSSFAAAATGLTASDAAVTRPRRGRR